MAKGSNANKKTTGYESASRTKRFLLWNQNSSLHIQKMKTVIAPGSTIGLLGGGQLGRMFGIAARRMGYRVHTFEPSPDSPAGQISDREFNGSFTEESLLEKFGASVGGVDFGFEKITPRSV